MPSSSSTHQRKRNSTAGNSRPRSSFVLFRQDYARQRAHQTMPPTSNAAKEAGDAWRALSDGQRQYYVNLAALEKEKHMARTPDVQPQQQAEIPVAEPEQHPFLGIEQGSVLRQPAPGHGASYFHSGGLPPSVNLNHYANEVGAIMNHWQHRDFEPYAMEADAGDAGQESYAVPQPYYNPSSGLDGQMWNTQGGAQGLDYGNWR